MFQFSEYSRFRPRSAWLTRCFKRRAVIALAALFAAIPASMQAEQKAIAVDDSTFGCITEMTQVRHFFVDNLLGDLDATVATAQAGQGVYPEGSLLQLVPFEAMVKREKGFNPATKDWEFFDLKVSPEGTVINTRGFAEVNNALGLNCFACHVKARPEFDFVCEEDHGCDPIPITRAMFGALQRTDPRCPDSETVSSEDQQALAELDAAIKELTSESN